MRRVALALALFSLCACAAKEQPQPGAECQEMFVLLPDNYIIDLAAGSRVVIDPALREFALFCEPSEAKMALARQNPPGNWRVYKLAGNPVEYAERRANGNRILGKPAEVADWVEAD